MATKEQKESEKDTTQKSVENTVPPQSSSTLSMRSNPWIISTVVLAIALILVIVFMRGGTPTGNVVSSDEAAQNVMDFIQSNPQLEGSLELVKSERDGQLYKITVNYQGNEVPVYATLDGKFLVSGVVPLEETLDAGDDTTPPEPQDIPKTDKPVVELFVMSHCPYGTQIEKGILPVVALLKDKIDFELKFVYYAMHGEKEVKEQLNQYCIQKEQNDKFLLYLTCFLKDGDGAACLKEANIDTKKLTTCTTAADKQFNVTANLQNKDSWLSGSFPLFDINKAENEEYGIGGSPSLVINGMEAQSGRDSASLLATICGAFSDEPEQCRQTLSSAQPSPGFGYTTASASSGSDAAQCG